MEGNLDTGQLSVLFSGTNTSAKFQGSRTAGVMAGGRSLPINTVINPKPLLQPSARLQLFFSSVEEEEYNHRVDAH